MTSAIAAAAPLAMMPMRVGLMWAMDAPLRMMTP